MQNKSLVKYQSKKKNVRVAEGTRGWSYTFFGVVC